MMREKVNLNTVAGATGVSVSTVSRALHHDPRISQATRQKIHRAIKRLGYRPNLSARILSKQRSETIGVLTAHLGEHRRFQPDILLSVELTAEQIGYSVLHAPSHGRSDREREMAEMLLQRGAEGLIVLPVQSEENRDYFAGLIEEGIPLVFAYHAVPGVIADSVTLDNEAAGRLAAEHLIRRGRKRIAFVGLRSRDPQYAWGGLRLSGCNRALQAAGLEPSVTLTRESEEEDIHWQSLGYDCLREYLSRFPRPCQDKDLQTEGQVDGIFAANDLVACGVLEALADCGLKVPDDVAVVGFDDLDVCQVVRPRLTSFRQPGQEIGEEAVRLLCMRLSIRSDGNDSPPRRRVLLEPTLIVRESCGGASEAKQLQGKRGGDEEMAR